MKCNKGLGGLKPDGSVTESFWSDEQLLVAHQRLDLLKTKSRKVPTFSRNTQLLDVAELKY